MGALMGATDGRRLGPHGCSARWARPAACCSRAAPALLQGMQKAMLGGLAASMLVNMGTVFRWARPASQPVS